MALIIVVTQTINFFFVILINFGGRETCFKNGMFYILALICWAVVKLDT